MRNESQNNSEFRPQIMYIQVTEFKNSLVETRQCFNTAMFFGLFNTAMFSNSEE